MTACLIVDSLTVTYGRVTAVRDVSFEVEQGSVVAILGRNGAGKSSLMAAIAGWVRPSSGHLVWNGTDVTHRPADRRARDGLVMVPEGRRILPHLTVEENLLLGGFYLGRSHLIEAMQRTYRLFPVLGERAGSPGGQLSGGQQQMLAIARALMGTPQVLLLDEPSLGLGPKVIDEVYEQLRRLREGGLTILLVEQHVSRALRSADHALVLHLGEIVLRASPSTLAEDPRLVTAYMGEGVR